MSAASLSSALLLVCACVFVYTDQIITAESGHDVTLTCRAPNNNITVVEWSRTDLESDFVLLYQGGNFDTDNQHPSFKNRVDLQDRQMKDGDVSLILKNVNTDDTGTYVCRVFMQETRSWKSISIVYLNVVPPGQTGDTEDGSVGLLIGLSLSAVLLVVVVGGGGFIYQKVKQRSCAAPDQRELLQSPQQNCQSADTQTDRNELS